MSITQLLLDFLLNLLKDPKAAEEFKADPEAALASHGLSDITEEDCDAVIPVVLDFAPVSAIGDRDYDTGGNVLKGGDSHYNNGGGSSPAPSSPSVGDGGGVAASPAVAQLTHVVNNYSYSSIDDRDTITDQSVNQNIWALGDVEQWFDNDANVASGDHAVAAGDDAAVDNSVDNSTNIHAGEDVNIGNTEVDVEDSYNDDHSTDNSVDLDVDIEDSIIADDSFNEDNSVNDSGNTEVDVNVKDSFQDNSDNSVNDSGNTDVDLENVLNDNSDNSVDESTNVDVDAEIEFEESFNDVEHTDNSTNVETGDIEAEFTNIEESLVVADNEVDVDVENETENDIFI